MLQDYYGVSTNEELWSKYSEGVDYIAEFQASVEENGGFYIGRYEASYKGGKAVTKESTVANTTDTLEEGKLWNNITQTDAIAKCEEMYNKEADGINSKLINSYAWDTALKFIEAVEGKNVDTDSTAWGNYYDDNFSGTTGLANTGKFEETKACNIYDLAGNLFEWTTEIYDTSIVVPRGGDYNDGGSNYPAGVRRYRDSSYSHYNIGFRPLLYK